MGTQWGPIPHISPSPLSAHAYCGQTVAHLSNCWALVNIWGTPVSIPFYRWGPNLVRCAIADSWYTHTSQILFRSVYSVVLWRRKSPIFAVFGLRHLMVSPFGSSLRNLNTGAHLQTFPYPTVSKSFLYSNAFMAKSDAQSLTFKSVRDTDRQTDKNRNHKHRRAAAKPAACAKPGAVNSRQQGKEEGRVR